MNKIILKENSIKINELQLEKPKDYWFIGRESNCDLVVSYRNISRVHCTIIRRSVVRKLFNNSLTFGANTKFFILDGNFGNPRSTNGIFFNNQKAHYYPLNHLTEVTLSLSPPLISLVFVEDKIIDDSTFN